MQLDHRPVEAERPLVNEAFRDDLIPGSQPAIEFREVGIGDDKVHIGMRPRRFQPEEFAVHPPTNATLKPAASTSRRARIGAERGRACL